MRNRYRLDCKESVEKEIMDFSKSEIPDFMYDLIFLDYSREIKWFIVNKLDIFNLKWLSDLEIESLLNNFLSKKIKEARNWDETSYKKIDINDEEALIYFNYIYLRAIDFYEKELKWKLPKKYKKTSDYFNSKEDIIKFLKDTTKWVLSSQINCSISKIIYAINEVMDTPELLELDKKSEYLAREKLVPATMIDDHDSLINFWVSTWKVIVSWKIIDFKVRIRGKEENSGALKILKDENYLIWSDLKDSIWLEFEVKDKESATLLLSYFYYTIFHKSSKDWEIINTINSFKNKWIIDKETVSSLSEKWLINWDFLELLNNLNFKPNPMQNLEYKDAKVLWETDIPINPEDRKSQKKWHSVELRAILVWNTNEEWLSDHRILHVWKIILTWIRLKWYITEAFIKHLINDLLNENKDLDEKFHNDEILSYFKSKLVIVDRKWKSTVYTMKNRNINELIK